jgi:PhnB protein
MSSSAPIAHLVVADGLAAIAFYEKAFGAVCNNKHMAEDGKRIMHAHLTIGGGAIFLNDDFPEFGEQMAKAPTRLGGTTFAIHLDVPDADAAWERAVKAGAQILVPLDNQFWGMRYGQLKDPFGHHWSIGGPLK